MSVKSGKKSLLLCCLGSILSVSYGGDLKTYPSKEANFSQYKTYRLAPPKFLAKTGVVEDDPVVAPLIKEAVNRYLPLKGLTEVTEGGDLEVQTVALTDAIPQLEAAYFAGGLDMAFATPIATMGRYNRRGTLVINLIDTRTKKSAWMGIATESLGNPGQEKNKKKVDKAAQRMLKKYPK